MPDNDASMGSETMSVTTPADFYREVKQFSDEYQAWHDRQVEEAKEQGRQLGSTNLPHEDERAATPYQGQLHGMYEGRLGLMQQRFNRKLQQWYAMYVRADTEASRPVAEWTRIKSEKRQQVDEKEADAQESILRTYNEKWTPLRDKRDSVIQSQMNRADSRLTKMQDKHGRQFPNASMPNQWLYFIVLAVIGACEFPLNAFVFAVVGADQRTTFLMAAALVIAIPIAAHFAGLFLKRREERTINLPLFAVISVSLVLLSYFMGELRCQFIEQTTGQPCDEGLEYLFVLLNVILFGLGVCLAYAHHDESREFEQAWLAWQAAKATYDVEMPAVQAELTAVLEEKQNKQARLSAEIAKDIGSINDMEIVAQQTRTDTVATYDGGLETLTGLERRVRANFREAVKAFQTENLAARSNHKNPVSFGQEIPELPKHYEEMEEVNPNPVIPSDKARPSPDTIDQPHATNPGEE